MLTNPRTPPDGRPRKGVDTALPARLEPRISAEECRRLFETIWTDRARNVGWNVEFACAGEERVSRFTRKAP